MHVVHIISNLGIGGAEVALTRLVKHQAGGPIRHSVVSMLQGGPNAAPLREAGAEVIELPGIRSIGATRLFPPLIALVRRLRPTLIQGWMYHGNLAAAAVRVVGTRSVPVVWGVRQTVSRLRDDKPLTRACILAGTLFRRVPAQIAYNSQLAAVQHERLGYPRRKRRIILNGIDTEQFRPSPNARLALRRQLGLPADAILIGRIARYAAMKDTPTLLRAFRELLQTHYGAHLVLIGTGMDETNRELTALLHQSSIGSYVRLMGQQLRVEEILPAFDLCLSSSSNTEGFPTVLAEAMACGVPVISTDVGEAAHIIADAARIVAPKASDALAASAARVLGLSPHARENLGQRDRQRVIECFGIGRFSAAFEQLWLEATGGQALRERDTGAIGAR
jgi:glycosyltransferase involved in cell wall biosynthesis